MATDSGGGGTCAQCLGGGGLAIGIACITIANRRGGLRCGRGLAVGAGEQSRHGRFHSRWIRPTKIDRRDHLHALVALIQVFDHSFDLFHHVLGSGDHDRLGAAVSHDHHGEFALHPWAIRIAGGLLSHAAKRPEPETHAAIVLIAAGRGGRKNRGDRKRDSVV